MIKPLHLRKIASEKIPEKFAIMDNFNHKDDANALVDYLNEYYLKGTHQKAVMHKGKDDKWAVRVKQRDEI